MRKEQIDYNIDFNTGKIDFIKDNIKYNVNKNENDISDIKLAIVGSRSITDDKFVNRILNCYKFMFGLPIKVISGGAKGIDSIGEAWADKLNIEKEIFIPDWENNGKAAGFIRNEDIIKNCDVCLAIWDGESHGTKNDSFSGFHHIIYNNDEKNTSECHETTRAAATTNSNRWLPKPGLIKI